MMSSAELSLRRLKDGVCLFRGLRVPCVGTRFKQAQGKRRQGERPDVCLSTATDDRHQGSGAGGELMLESRSRMQIISRLGLFVLEVEDRGGHCTQTLAPWQEFSSPISFAHTSVFHHHTHHYAFAYHVPGVTLNYH